ncbi:MAG: hypothetical protein P8X74_19220 [Reinekea sp.]
MNASDLCKYLGEKVSLPEFKDFLSQNSVELPTELDLPEGEYNAYIERPDEGYSMVFTDEAVFLGNLSSGLADGELFFSGVFLYSEGKDGYKQFEGIMPQGLNFNSLSKDFISSFGKADWVRKRTDGSVAAERWDNVTDYRIHITYDKTTGCPSVISLNKPDA